MGSAQVHYFHAHRKSPASKARVSAMATAGILHLDRAKREAARLDERQRLRKIVSAELQMAMRKMYAVMGPEEAERLIPWVQSAVEVEYRFKS